MPCGEATFHERSRISGTRPEIHKGHLHSDRMYCAGHGISLVFHVQGESTHEHLLTLARGESAPDSVRFADVERVHQAHRLDGTTSADLFGFGLAPAPGRSSLQVRGEEHRTAHRAAGGVQLPVVAVDGWLWQSLSTDHGFNLPARDVLRRSGCTPLSCRPVRRSRCAVRPRTRYRARSARMWSDSPWQQV